MQVISEIEYVQTCRSCGTRQAFFNGAEGKTNCIIKQSFEIPTDVDIHIVAAVWCPGCQSKDRLSLVD